MSYPPQPVAPRLFTKVEFTDECWVWQGKRHSQGYGLIRVNAKWQGAHRESYKICVGPIPEGLEIDHLCRVRLCINPDHLEAVTHRVNMLRGNGWSGRHARKTHCPQGHEYTAENTRVRKTSRYCRACARAREKARYARKV